MKKIQTQTNIPSKLDLEQSRMENESNLRVIMELAHLLQTERNYTIPGENSLENRLGLENTEVFVIKNKLIEYVNKL